MNKEIISSLHNSFESASKTENGVSYWFARDIQTLLEYTQWRNFSEVIEKAKISCEKAGQLVQNHFADVSKIVSLGAGGSREIKDIMLTRYACYLIAQNGDPRKSTIAFAQSYFAIQTRKQELLEERMQLTERDLSETIYMHDVDDRGFGIIRSKGDEALFGGYNTAAMKKRLGVKDSKPLADYLPVVTLKGKEFAAAITNHTVNKDNLMGTEKISEEHIKNNRNVRSVLIKSHIKPEELPPEEDIKKLERRVKSDDVKLLKSEGSLAKLDTKNNN